MPMASTATASALPPIAPRALRAPILRPVHRPRSLILPWPIRVRIHAWFPHAGRRRVPGRFLRRRVPADRRLRRGGFRARGLIGCRAAPRGAPWRSGRSLGGWRRGLGDLCRYLARAAPWPLHRGGLTAVAGTGGRRFRGLGPLRSCGTARGRGIGIRRVSTGRLGEWTGARTAAAAGSFVGFGHARTAWEPALTGPRGLVRLRRNRRAGSRLERQATARMGRPVTGLKCARGAGQTESGRAGAVSTPERQQQPNRNRSGGTRRARHQTLGGHAGTGRAVAFGTQRFPNHLPQRPRTFRPREYRPAVPFAQPRIRLAFRNVCSTA